MSKGYFISSQSVCRWASLQWQCRVVAKEIVSWLRFSLSHHHFCERPRTEFWNTGLPRCRMQYMEKEHAKQVLKKRSYFNYFAHYIDTKTQASQECISHFSLGNSRKYPHPTTGGMNIITPPCLCNSKMHWLLMPTEYPPPFRISVFFLLQPSGILVWLLQLPTEEMLHFYIFPELCQLSTGLENATNTIACILD